MKLILGLTGPNAAGKGEVAECLRQRGFALHSLSDIVREEAARRGLPAEREHLIRIGNLLREEGGAGVLAERILPRLGSRDVVDSIRNPTEVEVLRRNPDFILLGVDAPVGLRFSRARQRRRPGDGESLEQFAEREARENSADPRAQQLGKTLALADHRFDNSGEIEGLHRTVEEWLSELEAVRP